MSAGWQTTLIKPRLAEATFGLTNSLALLLDNKLEPEEKKKYTESMVTSYKKLVDAYDSLASDEFFEIDEWYSYNLDAFWNMKMVAASCIDSYQMLLQILDTDNDFPTNLQVEIMKSICDCCQNLCTYVVCYVDYSMNAVHFRGLLRLTKKTFLNYMTTWFMKLEKLIINMGEINYMQLTGWVHPKVSALIIRQGMV